MGRDAELGPPVEIIDLEGTAEPATRVSVGGGPGRGRGLAGLAVAAVVVVAVLTAVGSSDDREPSSEAADETTSTERDDTTTTRRVTTTTLPPVGPIIPEAGGSFLIAMSDRDATAVDLATGARVELELREPWSAVPVAGGVVEVRDGAAFFAPVDGGEHRILGSATSAVATERADLLWLIDGPGGSPGGQERESTARLVDLAGSPIAGPIPLPGSLASIAFFGGPSGAVGTSRYLVVPGSTRHYRLDLDGRLAPLDGFHAAAPVSADEVAGTRCDAEAVCHMSVLELGTGNARDLRAQANPGGFDFRSARDPATGRVALVHWGHIPTVIVIDPVSGAVEEVDSLGDIGSVTWLPAGDLLIASPLRRWGGDGVTTVAGTDRLDAQWIAVVPG